MQANVRKQGSLLHGGELRYNRRHQGKPDTGHPLITEVFMTLDPLILLELLIVIAVGFVLYTLARRGLGTMQKRNLLTLQTHLILKGTIKWSFIIAITFTCLSIIGISATSIWASLSAVLMLVALGFVAVWSILSNASCALFLVVFSPFRIGDEIEIIEASSLDPDKPGLKGRVINISFIYTTLVETAPDGTENRVHVPNNQLFQRAIRCRRGDNTSSLKAALFEKAPKEENADV